MAAAPSSPSSGGSPSASSSSSLFFSSAGSAAYSAGTPASWTRHENKAFELALCHNSRSSSSSHSHGALLDSDSLWEDIAAALPGRSSSSVKAHFNALILDIQAIDSGRIPFPCYSDEASSAACASVASPSDAANAGSGNHGPGPAPARPRKDPSSGKTPLSKAAADLERRKGIPWTEEEHKSFLLGLAKFGKGDWRSISRNFVRTRTPTQVASHAQKYFIRLNSMKKDRRRSSIHDITSINGDAVQTSQGPITGHGMQGHLPASGFMEGTAFSPAVGQPVMTSTVGTPVLISPAGYNGPMVSGAPLARPIMPGPPVGMLPVAYTVAQPMPPS